MRQPHKFTVLIEREETGCYVASLPALRGCHAQARNLDTLMKRIREAAELCLEENNHTDTPLELVGILQISI